MHCLQPEFRKEFARTVVENKLEQISGMIMVQADLKIVIDVVWYFVVLVNAGNVNSDASASKRGASARKTLRSVQLHISRLQKEQRRKRA